MNVSKLGLGTVQFGLDYGVSNAGGKTPSGEVAAILGAAAATGVRTLDTAPSYGDSETVLGAALPAGHRFEIVTKVPHKDVSSAALRAAFAVSLQQLRVPRVHGLIAHEAGDLLGPEGESLWEAMIELKSSGQVAAIGSSVYRGDQIEALLARYPLDMVQLPINVFDQRLLQGGQLQLLREHGVRVHARSALLQGLLLMEPETLLPYFEPVQGKLRQFRVAAAAAEVSPLAAALGFVAGLPQVDVVLCGVNTLGQFREIVQALESTEGTDIDYAQFALDDPEAKFVNPAVWPNAHA